jgi:hypothetical protein
MDVQKSRINVLDRRICILGKDAGKISVVSVVEEKLRPFARNETKQPELNSSYEGKHIPNAENPTGWFPRGIHLDHIREDY